ncbi:MAG: hypothetical protein NVSMB51_16640 [Solirubrobacteraceae bacterium]
MKRTSADRSLLAVVAAGLVAVGLCAGLPLTVAVLTALGTGAAVGGLTAAILLVSAIAILWAPRRRACALKPRKD